MRLASIIGSLNVMSEDTILYAPQAVKRKLQGLYGFLRDFHAVAYVMVRSKTTNEAGKGKV